MPEVVSKSLATAGFDLSEQNMTDLGRAVHAAKYAFKFREGFTLDDMRVPKRILETPALSQHISEDFLRRALTAFGSEMSLPQ